MALRIVALFLILILSIAWVGYRLSEAEQYPDTLRDRIIMVEGRLSFLERQMMDVQAGGTSLSRNEGIRLAVIESSQVAQDLKLKELTNQLYALYTLIALQVLAVAGFGARYYVTMQTKRQEESLPQYHYPPPRHNGDNQNGDE